MSHGSRIYKLEEVFVKSGVPLHTFVDREILKKELESNITLRSNAIFFLGYSKSGKTVFRKKYFDSTNEFEECLFRCSRDSTKEQLYNFMANEFQIHPPSSTTETNSSSNEGRISLGISNLKLLGKKNNLVSKSTTSQNLTDKIDVNYLCKSIPSNSKKIIVLEDYHLLDRDFTESFTEDLKHFLDQEIVFIIIGIPSSPDRTFAANPDLTGRVKGLNFDYLTEEESRKLISKGEKCLNIRIDDESKKQIFEKSFGNAYLIQSICQEVFRKSNVESTSEIEKVINVLDSIDTACRELASSLKNDYSSIMEVIIKGARKQQEGKAFNQYEEILKSIKSTDISDLEKGLSHTTIASNTWSSFGEETINKFVKKEKKYQSEKSFKGSVQSQITSALNSLEENFKKANARKIIHVYEKTLYLSDIVFKFYLDWSEDSVY